MKKLKKSPLTYICYVLAVLSLGYCVVLAQSTISQIVEYYAAYDMSPMASEIITYLLQTCMSPLAIAFLLLMAGVIYNEVRKANPANWLTEEEIAAKAKKKKGSIGDDAAELFSDNEDEVEVGSEALKNVEESVDEFSAEVAEVEDAAAEDVTDAVEGFEAKVAEVADAVEEEFIQTAMVADDVKTAVKEVAGEVAEDAADKVEFVKDVVSDDTKKISDALKSAYNADNKDTVEFE